MEAGSVRETAKAYYHGTPDNFNCAQAVLAAFLGREDPRVEEAARYGTGRAPRQMCGAAYAGVLLRPDLSRPLAREFEKKAGSFQCMEIKARRRLPCRECVGLACDVLQRYGLRPSAAAEGGKVK